MLDAPAVLFAITMDFVKAPMSTRRLALWALFVIFLANFLNYTDRQLVSALEKPLRGALNLTGVEYGLLWTLFTVGYMLCAVPIGLLADRLSRTRLFAFCIVIWSVATIASGMAQTKMVLYIARIFIGVGEAGCLVIGPSLISDFYKQRVRGKALSIFFLGMPLGGTMAFIMAGLLIDTITWREMFVLAGAPGILIAVFIWVLPEPERGESEEGAMASHSHAKGGSFRDYFHLLKTPTLMLIILAQAFGVFILIPIIHYGVEYFISMRGMGEQETRVTLGLMALVAGTLGSLLAGVVGDLLARKMKGAYAFLAGIGYLASLPCLLVGFHAETKWVFLAALTGGCFFIFLCMPAVNTQIANVVRPRHRATAWALAVFILHLLGDTVSPPLFGAVNQHFGMLHTGQLGLDAESVSATVGPAMSQSLALQVSYGIGRQYAFTWFAFALVPASVCCFIAAMTARRDIAWVEEQERKELAQEGEEKPSKDPPPSLSDQGSMPPT